MSSENDVGFQKRFAAVLESVTLHTKKHDPLMEGVIAKKNRSVEIIINIAISKHLQGKVEGEIYYWIQKLSYDDKWKTWQ